MKPLFLSVKGLHSFREEQTVDFSQLCARGVFGIFGPTGSGKSTLLDAITLALYGKVERAVNNTHGIINHAEDEVVVSFTFELAKGSHSKRYRVERSFKRSGDVTVRTASARLLEIADEQVVLADKAQDVNQKVIQLLGLSSEDFTRAVVLPQGKFAEFLSLKGTDRRQMLQRLFNLERYGDQLRQRLGERLQATTHELDQVKAELAGLGDASEEALKKARCKVKQSEEALNQALLRLKTLEKEYERQKKIWSWQEELHQLLREQGKLDQERETIQDLKHRLNLADQAKALLPYVEEHETSQKEMKRWQEAVQKAERELNQAQSAYETAQRLYEQCQQKRNQQEPLLSIRLEQLNQARKLKDRLHQLDGEAREIEENRSRAEREMKEIEAALAKEQDLKKRGEEKQKALKEQLSSLYISSQYKQTIYEAHQRLREIELLGQKRDELKREHQEFSNRLKEDAQRLERLKEAVEGERGNLRELLHHHQRLSEQVTHFHHQLHKRQEEINALLAVAQKQLEESRMSHLAWELAQNLTEGNPCPVCGSRHHPAPFSQPIDEKIGWTEQINRLNQLKQQIDLLIQRVHPLHWQLKQGMEQLIQWLTPTQDQDQHLQETEKNLDHEQLQSEISLPQKEVAASELSNLMTTTTDGEGPVSEVHQDRVYQVSGLEHDGLEKPSANRINRLEEQMQTVQHEMEAMEKRVANLEEKAKDGIKRLKERAEAYDKVYLALTAHKEQLEQLTKKWKDAQEKAERELGSWQELYPQFTREQIPQLVAELGQKEKLVEELNQRLEKSFPFLKEKEERIEKLNSALNESRVRLAQLESSLTNKRETMKELVRQLEEIVPTKDVNAETKRVEKQLDDLRKEEKQASLNFEQAQKHWQEQEKILASAIQAFRQAEQRWHSAHQKLLEKLADSPFDHSDAVIQAIMQDEDYRAAKEQVDHYEENQNKLTVQIQRLKELLEGHTLSEEEWQATNTQWEDAKQTVDAAREAKGAAVEMLHELNVKHERYRLLNKRREELERTETQYKTLNNVLKGNAFVEFLAEEQLIAISRDASQRLSQLTRGRYAIEVDSGGGFIIRDDANGGVKRPVSSLSGGETFLTSLALALSLSASIQLRGEYPLQFFFLDEGFGTLDQDLLETVVSALEKLHSQQLSIGVISHVPELRARLPRKLIVEPAQPGGRGSRVRLEVL